MAAAAILDFFLLAIGCWEARRLSRRGCNVCGGGDPLRTGDGIWGGDHAEFCEDRRMFNAALASNKCIA